MAKPRKPRKPGKKIIRKRVNVSLRNKAGATARGRRMAAVLGPTSGYEGHKTIETVVDVPGSAAAKDRALKQGGKKQGGKKQGTPKAVAKARAKNAANRPTADRPATTNRRPDATRRGRGTRTEGTQGRAAKTMASRPVGNMGRDEFTTEYRAALTAAREGEPGAAARVRQLREHGKSVGYLGDDGKPTRPARDRDAAKKAPDTAGGDRKPPTTPPAAPAATGDQPERPRPQNDGPAENGPAEGYDEFELEEQWIEASANNRQHELADTDTTPPHDPAQFREAALQMRDTDLEAEWAELEQDLIDLGDPPRMDTPEDVAALEAAIDAALAYGAELDARNNEANPFHADAPDLDTDGVDMPNTRPGDEAEWLTGLDDDELERVIRDAKPELRDMADEEMERRYPWREDGVLQRMLSHRTMTDIRREQKRLLGDGNEVYDKQDIYKMAGAAGNYRYVAHAEHDFVDWLHEQARNAATTTVTDAKHQQEINEFLGSGIESIGSPIMMQSMSREMRDAATRLGFIPNRANWARIQRGEAPRPYNGELTMKRMYGRKKRRTKDEIIRDSLKAEGKRAARERKAAAPGAETPGGGDTVPETTRPAADAANTAREQGDTAADAARRTTTRPDADTDPYELRGMSDAELAETIAETDGDPSPDVRKENRAAKREQRRRQTAATDTNERDTNAAAEKAATDRNKADADARKQRATANAIDGEEVTEQGNIRRGNALMWENRDGTYSVQPIDGERVPRGKGMKADTLDDARRIADRIGAGEVPNERTADNAGKTKVGKPGPNAKTVDANAKAEKPKPMKKQAKDAENPADGNDMSTVRANLENALTNAMNGDKPQREIDALLSVAAELDREHDWFDKYPALREKYDALNAKRDGDAKAPKETAKAKGTAKNPPGVPEPGNIDVDGVETHPLAARRPAPFTSRYMRNTESLKTNQVADMDFGQKIEPAGRYLLLDHAGTGPVSEGWESGEVSFSAPLWIDATGLSSKDWKQKLTDHYGGKTGKALSRAVRNDGYDAIVTFNDAGTSEVVDLTHLTPTTKRGREVAEKLAAAAKGAGTPKPKADAAKRATKSAPKAKPAGKTKPVKNWRSELTTADGDMPLVESAPNMSDDDLVTAYKGLSADVRRYRAEANKHRKAKNTYDARSATREGDRYETQRSQIGEELRRRGFKLNALDKGRQNGTTERGDRDAKAKSDAANQQRKDAARVTHVGDRLNAGADLEGLTDDDLRSYRAALDAAPETTRNTVPENITRNLAAEEKRRGLDGATADTTPAQKPAPKAKKAAADAPDPRMSGMAEPGSALTPDGVKKAARAEANKPRARANGEALEDTRLAHILRIGQKPDRATTKAERDNTVAALKRVHDDNKGKGGDRVSDAAWRVLVEDYGVRYDPEAKTSTPDAKPLPDDPAAARRVATRRRRDALKERDTRDLLDHYHNRKGELGNGEYDDARPTADDLKRELRSRGNYVTADGFVTKPEDYDRAARDADAPKPKKAAAHKKGQPFTGDHLQDGETLAKTGAIQRGDHTIISGDGGYQVMQQYDQHHLMKPVKTLAAARKQADRLQGARDKKQAELRERAAARTRTTRSADGQSTATHFTSDREPVVDGITIDRDRNNRYTVTDTNGAGNGTPARKVGDYATIEEARAARDAEVADRKADAARKADADDLMKLPQRERDIAVYDEVQGETYTTAEVAEMTGLTPAQARATLNRLEANGLVFRSDDNDDQGLGSRRNVSGGRTSMDNLAWTDAYRDDDGAVADAVNAYDPKKGAEKPAPAKKATAKKATDTPTVDPKKQQRAADAAEKHTKAEKAHATATAKVERAMRENTTDRINADTETAAINAAKAFIRERNAKAAQLRAEIAANPDKDTPEARKAIADAEKATKGAKVNNIGSKEFKAVKADIIAAAEAKRPAIGKPTPKKDPVDEPDMTPEDASKLFDAVLAEVDRKKAENGGVMPTDPEFERRQKQGLGRGEVLPGTLKPGDHVITPYGKARVKRVNLNNVVVENPVTADPRRPLPDVDDLAVFRYDHIAVPPGSDAAFREPDTTGLREGTAKIGDYPTVGLGRNPHRSDYYTTAELEERGWTRAKLKDIVGKPDGVKKFREKIAADGDGSQRGDYSGYNVNLYSRARIELAEADYPDEDFGPHRAPEVPTIEGLDIDRVATEAGRTIFPITNAKDLAGDADLSSAWLDTKGKLNVRGDDKARDRIQAVIDNGPSAKPDPRMSGMAEPGSVLTPDGVEAAAPSIRDQIRAIVSPGGKVNVERRKAERESPLGVKRDELVARMKSHPEKDTMPPSSRSLEWHQLNVELAETELAGGERRLAQIEQDIADFKSKGATDKDLFTLNARQKATKAGIDKDRERVQAARKQASAKQAEQALAADAKKPADLTTKAPGGNKWEVTVRDEYPVKSTKIGPDKKSPDEVAQWLAEFATTFKGDRKSDESISIQFQDAMVGAWAREGNTADVDFYLGMFARGTDVQDAEFMVGTPGVAAIDAEKLARTRSAKSARKIIDEGIAKETKQVGSQLARDIMLDESRNDPRELSFVVFALTEGNVRDKFGRVPKDANAEEARLAANIAERLHRADPDRLGYGFDGVAQSFREVANQIDPDGAPTPAATLDPRSNERIMRETARAELGVDGDLVIEHTPEGGTLIHGTSRGDGTSDVLKANGWRWSRNLGAWYVPRTRDQRADGDKIDRTATALEADGHKVGTDIDDTVRSAAEREAAKAERADDRAAALADKADRKRAAADTAWQKDKEATDRVPPMGEPVKVGHHSERGHRRAIDRAWQTLGNAVEAEKDAKEANRRAAVAARANDARNDPITVANRIDGLEADIRRMERARVTGPELDTARDDLTYWRGVHEQHIADGKIASQNPDDYKPGMFLVQGSRLYRIAKVNKKTLSVETEGPTEGKPGLSKIGLNKIRGRQVTPEEAEAILRELVADMSDDDLRNKIGYNRSVHSYGVRDAMKAELARREGTEPPAPEMPLTPPAPGAYEKHQRGRILKRHVKVDEGETLEKGKIKRGDFTIGNSQSGYTVTDAAGNSSLGEHGQRWDIDVARERVDAMQADRDLLGRDSEVLGMSDTRLARLAETGSGDRRRDAQELLAARNEVAEQRARNFDEYVDDAEQARRAAAAPTAPGFVPPGSYIGENGIVTPETTTPESITLEYDAHGNVDRKQVLAAFADGVHVKQVFGPDRPRVAQSIAAHVRGIMPTKAEVTRAAYGYGDERRINAYRNGREYLLSAYSGYVSPDDLPALDSDDLPEGE